MNFIGVPEVQPLRLNVRVNVSGWSLINYNLQITLQDEAIKNKVRVIMVSFSKNVMPKSKDFVNNIYLDVENNKGLYSTRKRGRNTNFFTQYCLWSD